MIGTAPESSHSAGTWPTHPLKQCGSLEGGSGFPVEEQGLTSAGAEIPFFKVKDLKVDRWLTETDNYISRETAARLGATIFPPSTIVFAKVGAALLLNRFRLLGRIGCIDNNMMAIQVRDQHNVAFIRYVLDGADLSANFNQGPVPSVNTRQVSAIKIPRPPLLEQDRIAAYLDASCAAIDAAVAAKRRQLKILDAITLAVIHQAITRGINTDVRFRRSGMDWVSEVPAHWHVQQIKRTCEIVRGKFSHRPRNDPAYYGGEHPFVQTGDITAAGKYIRTYSQTLNELGLSVSKVFPRDTLVMSIAANIGDVAILDFEACFPDSMVGLIPGHKTDLNFLYYMMRAMKGEMLRSAVISTQLNLNNVRIGTNFAAFPPLREQQAIGEYLDKKEHEIFTVKETLNQQIETLTAYRTSLIHECVTGQRRISAADVRAIASQTARVAVEAHLEPTHA